MSRSAVEFHLERFLLEERACVDEALRRAVARLTEFLPDSLAGPLEDGVLADGKRLRPIFCAAAYRSCRASKGAVGHPSTALYDFAASLELIHAYSLMHDDLPCMDDAPLRRGRPTPHTVHGESNTVLAGAALIPAAAMQAWRAATDLGLAERARREAVRILARAAGPEGMVGGQGLDLLGEGRTLSRPELDDLHRRKTGALIVASLELGAVAAGAGSRARGALRAYGEEIGLAFQIADDVLDATADASALGKNPSDLALAKSTYVGLLGVVAARKEAERRVRVACGHLEAVRLDSPALVAMAHFVVERDR